MAYDAGESWLAAHALIPQLERALRVLGAEVGAATFRASRRGGLEWASLDHMLSDPTLSKALCDRLAVPCAACSRRLMARTTVTRSRTARPTRVTTSVGLHFSRRSPFCRYVCMYWRPDQNSHQESLSPTFDRGRSTAATRRRGTSGTPLERHAGQAERAPNFVPEAGTNRTTAAASDMTARYLSPRPEHSFY